MDDFTILDMFAERSYEATLTVRAPMMSAKDRKRLLIHATAELTQKILEMPNANPEGLTITVHSEQSEHADMWPSLVVTATCPQYAKEVVPD